MSLRKRLQALAAIIADEAERNISFGRKVEDALDPGQQGVPRLQKQGGSDQQTSEARSSRKGGRRTPAVLDPLALVRQSEELLRRDLATLNIEQLIDIVAEYGMDPGKLVMKWKDTTRIIERIVELSMARSTKGDAFRADKSTPEN